MNFRSACYVQHWSDHAYGWVGRIRGGFARYLQPMDFWFAFFLLGDLVSNRAVDRLDDRIVSVLLDGCFLIWKNAMANRKTLQHTASWSSCIGVPFYVEDAYPNHPAPGLC